MALKFPSQSKLQYVSGSGISNDGWTAYGKLNLPKDLSLLNRRGYSSTDKKGIPYVFRCRFTLFPQDEDGFGYDVLPGIDFATTLKIDGCQNNWVMKNGAVKWHAARDAMWKKAGIKRRNLGTYAKLGVKYNYSGAGDTWLVPLDGDGDAFTGGDWDIDTFSDEQDATYQLKIVGVGVDEDSTTDNAALNVGYSYLMSRTPPPEDSNLETSEGPAEYSHLNRLLSETADYSARTDDIHDDVQALGDAPPYDNWTTEDINNDITESVELGRCVAGLGNSFGQVIVDIPFGICTLRATHYSQADDNVTNDVSVAVEVLDIYPMQG